MILQAWWFCWGWGARDLRGVCFRAVCAVYAVWTQFYPLKVLLASVGYARAAIIFIVRTFYARLVLSTADSRLLTHLHTHLHTHPQTHPQTHLHPRSMDTRTGRGRRLAHAHQSSQIMSVGCFAERRQGGGRRPGDSRAAEQHAGMIRYKSQASAKRQQSNTPT